MKVSRDCKGILTVIVEDHLPVTALFTCACLFGSGVGSKSKVFQVQNQEITCQPIGILSDSDRAIENICEWTTSSFEI